MGERAASGALPHGPRPGPLMRSDGCACRFQLLFCSPVMVSSILCSPPWGPCSRFFPAHPTFAWPLSLTSSCGTQSEGMPCDS